MACIYEHPLWIYINKILLKRIRDYIFSPPCRGRFVAVIGQGIWHRHGDMEARGRMQLTRALCPFLAWPVNPRRNFFTASASSHPISHTHTHTHTYLYTNTPDVPTSIHSPSHPSLRRPALYFSWQQCKECRHFAYLPLLKRSSVVCRSEQKWNAEWKERCSMWPKSANTGWFS